jgi:hypothetical protein
MMQNEREQMFALCAQIADEKEPAKFIQLIKELNALLDRKEQRLGAIPNTR